MQDFDSLRIMEIMMILVRVVFYILVFSLFFYSCASLRKQFNLKDDSIFEEIVEEILENETGVKIDLTPDSKEGREI